jgi:hypothetical protein
VAAALVVASAAPASAIPAFARKYQISCSTCHAPFPRLKPYGEEFAGRGFRMEDPAAEPARATLDVGDPLLRLPRDLPLALRFDGFASYKEDAAAETDFELPWVVKLLSGGPIHDRISYYVYGIFEDGESIKLEDAWVQFNSVAGMPVDLLAGQFQVSDPLFKRELRLERNDYEIYRIRVGEVPTNLTYDRGLVITWHAPAEVDAVLEVVNGNGIGAVTDGDFDGDADKNFAGRLVRSFGPTRLGVFGGWGRSSGPAGAESDLWVLGPDVALDVGDRWQLNAQYLERRDSDPRYERHAGDDFVTRGGFAEAHWLPQGADGRWVLTGLYNWIESDVEPRYQDASLTCTRLLRRNFRLVAEGEYDLEAERTRASLGFSTAF